jgi:autotransporter-associated beta strand protein
MAASLTHQVQSRSATRTLTTTGTLAAGALTVSAASGFTGDITVTAGSVVLSTGHGLFFDANDSVGFMGNTTTDQLVLNTGTALGNQLVIGAFLGGSRDYDHANQSNPTLFIHSGTDPDTANDEWISFAHDGTNGVIATGSGYTGVSSDLHVANGYGLVVGHTAQVTAGVTGEFQILGTAAADATAIIGGFGATPNMYFLRSRAAIGSNTKVEENDTGGYLAWLADDGTDYNSNMALIYAELDGATGTNDTPGRLIFATTADGAASATVALTLDSAQNATFAGSISIPAADKLYFDGGRRHLHSGDCWRQSGVPLRGISPHVG